MKDTFKINPKDAIENTVPYRTKAIIAEATKSMETMIVAMKRVFSAPRLTWKLAPPELPPKAAPALDSFCWTKIRATSTIDSTICA